MKLSLVSLAVGLVGALYGVLNVRSPSPPVVALVGLLGTLMGEQIPPFVRHISTVQPGKNGDNAPQTQACGQDF
jgi:XapX domain-containing protein